MRTIADVVLLVVVLALIVWGSAAFAAPVSAPGTPGIRWLMCEEPGNAVKFRQPAGTTDLIISCTASPTSLTIKGCVGPRVKKVGDQYTVTCSSFKL
jgi:hypothetical protein